MSLLFASKQPLWQVGILIDFSQNSRKKYSNPELKKGVSIEIKSKEKNSNLSEFQPEIEKYTRGKSLLGESKVEKYY